ncbi:MAG: hypothetical protein K2I63_00230, partial [Helicobacter sp.]|nr:hypothetical protein [Helicobacter sp.]
MKPENILQMFFTGVFLSFILTCIFWAGIFSNYIQYYGIRISFNPFFSDVFNSYIFFIMVVIFGGGFFIPFLSNIIKSLYGILLFIALLLLIPPLGRTVGEAMFSKEITLAINGNAKNVLSLYEDKFYIVFQYSKVTPST